MSPFGHVHHSYGGNRVTNAPAGDRRPDDPGPRRPACGNSGDDDDAADDGGATDDAAEPTGEEERDTFVSLDGVPGRDRRGDPLRRRRHAGRTTRSAPASSTATSTASRPTSPSATARAASTAATSCSARCSTTSWRRTRSGRSRSSRPTTRSASSSATLIASGWGDLDDAGIPTYAWGIHAAEAASRQHIFPSIGDPVRRLHRPRRALRWPSWPGADTVASLGYGDHRELEGRAPSRRPASVELYADDTGAEVGYVNDDLDFGLPNGIGPEVTAMKEAGVDFISTCIDLNGMKTLAQELERQGMDDVVLLPPEHLRPALRRRGGRPVRGRLRLACSSGRSRPTPGDSQLADFLRVDGGDGQRAHRAGHGRAGSTPTSPSRACSPPGPSSTATGSSPPPTR